MHQLSYTGKNPVFSWHGCQFTIQVFTFKNLYELDKETVSFSEEYNTFMLIADSFTWAGGQEHAAGRVQVNGCIENGIMRFSIEAVHETEKIRCVKLTLKQVPQSVITNLRQPLRQSADVEIPKQGLILKYPEGFAPGLYTPLVVLRQNDTYMFIRSLDHEVRPKTFALVPTEDGFLDVELIFEECARKFDKKIKVPDWEFGYNTSYERIMDEQKSIIEKNYGLVNWEDRKDVPQWAKEISLVASIHCQHWTGYVFNTYDEVIKSIQKIAQKVDPKRLLAFLPGWEGRYYYQYGDLRPCPRLGGENGFKKLMDAAKEMGTHIMPMFMINGANPHHENFYIWGGSSLYHTASGYPVVWGSCDWDSSRHYDHNCGFPLNPGAPLWQDRLVNQVIGLIEKYGFDGVFMDLAAVYINDPRYDTYQATIDISNRIRKDHPEVLMSGEGWYDAISASIPLTQPSLSEDGDCRWSDRPYAPLFDTYNRCFAHLGTGDFSRGSTGVFEFGNNYTTQKTPLRKGIIPTITIVDGTLENAPEKANMIFEQANTYADLFL